MGKAGIVVTQWRYIRGQSWSCDSSVEIHKGKDGMVVAQWRYIRAKLEL
jgi:hypothetical protein